MAVTFTPTNAIVSTVAFMLIMNAFVNGCQPPTNPDDSGSSLRCVWGGE